MAKGRSEKPEKNSSLYLRLIHSTETSNKNYNNNKTQQTQRKGENLISSITILLISNAQFLTKKKKKNHKTDKNKVWPIQRKKKSTRTVPKKKLMVDILDKNFKTIILKTLKELKKDVYKLNKIMYEQNGNINKESS